MNLNYFHSFLLCIFLIHARELFLQNLFSVTCLKSIRYMVMRFTEEQMYGLRFTCESVMNTKVRVPRVDVTAKLGPIASTIIN